MKILLVYPLYPDTFWSFKHALRFIAKKALHPPLGLLTVAAMLPAEWEKRLIDMNTDTVRDSDLKWADYVFVGGMAVQRQSAKDLIARCKEAAGHDRGRGAALYGCPGRLPGGGPPRAQ